MEQRSQNHGCSRKNSTYEHETSTREQILGKEQFRTKPKHRKSLDLSQSRSSPPPGNIHTSKSIFLDEEYKRQGLKLQQLQQKIINLERQLLMERKKNNRLKKVISSKIDKEKELELAYRDIVIQLKKQIKMNPLCFCKSKNSSERLIDSRTDPLLDLKIQVNNLNDQKKELQQDIKKLQAYLSSLRNESKSKQEQNAKLSKCEVKCAKNQQKAQIYQPSQLMVQRIIGNAGNQLGEVEKQSKRKQLTAQNQHKNHINQLKQLIKQSSFQFKHDFSDKDRLSVNQYKMDSLYSRESMKSLQQNEKKAQDFKHQYILSTQIPANEQKKEHCKVETDLFSNFLQSNEAIHQKLQKQKYNENQVPKIGVNDSYNTVHQLSQDSFESIVSARNSQIQQNDLSFKVMEKYVVEPRDSQFKSIVYQPDFSNVSSVSIMNKSNKSINYSQNQFQNILKANNSEQAKFAIEELKRQIIKLQQFNNNLIDDNNRQSQKDRQAVFRFLENIRIYINKLGTLINQYGNKYKTEFQAPQISSIAFIASSRSPLSEILPDLNEFNSKADFFLTTFLSKISQVTTLQHKQLQKKLNNFNLQLHDSKSQLKEYREQKESLTKRVQQLKFYISKLEYQLSELSSISKQPLTLEQKQRNNFIRQVMKQKYSERQVKVIESESQCQIISLGDFKKLQNFIKTLPLLVGKYLSKKKIKCMSFSQINLQGNLQAQFLQIFQKSFTSIENSKSLVAEQQVINRKYSLSLKDIGQFSKKVQKPEIDPEAHYIMQAELKFLQTKLAQKQKIIQKLQQLLASGKRQSLKKQADFKKIVVEQPKDREQQRKDYFSTISKVQKQQVASQFTPQFREYSQIKQYNNLSLGKDELVKELKEKVETLQKQIIKYRSQGHKKKKVHFLNH